MENLSGKKVLLAVTGGIAAYKACSLVNYLLKEGAEVKIVMSDNATRFVTPLTFQALANSNVYVDMWDIQNPKEVEHITLAQWPNLIIIAPASANTIAKIAYGIADNLLTTVILASIQEIPVLIAPAMNTQMWINPITQQNIEKLKKIKKFAFVGPEEGKLACRDEGVGKIASLESIVSSAIKLLLK